MTGVSLEKEGIDTFLLFCPERSSVVTVERICQRTLVGLLIQPEENWTLENVSVMLITEIDV